MTYEAFASGDMAPFDHATRARKTLPEAVLCGIALTLSSSIGLWIFYAHQAAQPARDMPAVTATVEAPAPALPTASASNVTIDVAPQPVQTAAKTSADMTPFGTLLDPGFTSADTDSPFARSVLAKAGFATQPTIATADLEPIPMIPPPVATKVATAEPTPAEPQVAEATPADSQVVPTVAPVSNVVETVPMPVPRPNSLQTAEKAMREPTAPRRVAETTPAASIPPAHAAEPSFFEKMFGKQDKPGTAMAYAPEDGGLGGLFSSRPTSGGGTAVYDISAHTVYLPDGTRLEAHSGLGPYKDNPSSIGVRMRGATPVATYDLTLRESLFHGVQALRLTPIGNSDTLGRGGLLAHTFMLGPNGDSNGCVVFRDYQSFLRAYQSGRIRRLQVVASLH